MKRIVYRISIVLLSFSLHVQDLACITQKQADQQFKQILKIKTTATSENSDSFGKALQENRQDDEKLGSLFNQVKLQL